MELLLRGSRALAICPDWETVRIRFLIFLLVFLCSWTWARDSSARNSEYLISIQFENDFFGGGTDRHFTHGTRIECLTKPLQWIARGADKLPWFSTDKGRNELGEAFTGRGVFSLGQSIFTPENTAAAQIIPEERPYAGWLYVGFGIVANQGARRYDKLELEIGMVGPYSFAEEVQTFWHSLFGLDVPQGWDNQLKSEPGAVLYYEQARRYERRVIVGLEADVIPHFGGSLGNVFTHAAAGVVFRLGSKLDDDFGPPRIRPSLPGGVFFRPGKGFNWYVFTGLEGRAVLRNIFLDGNTFTDSPSVDKNIFVGDVQAGVVMQWNRFRVSYTQIFRTKEFKGQDRGDIFGSLSFSYHF
jgi:lipid A 3-O-deacylase